MRDFVICLGAVAAIWAGAGVQAGPIAQRGAAAEAAVEAQDFPRAFDQIDAALDLIWDQSPLYSRKTLFVDNAQGYGLYTERASGPVFAQGEQLLVYLEPVGFGYGASGTGSYILGFDVGVTLLKPSGEQLFAREKFTSIQRPVRYRNREFYLTLNLNFNGLPAGDYEIQLTFDDQNTDKSMLVELPFTISEQG